MGYEMDMTQEQEKKQLLPEGNREFEIAACEEFTSRQGNLTFKFTFADCQTHQELDVYAVGEPKKRWFLKQILYACEVDGWQNGIYKWDIPDVLDKIVLGEVVHAEEEWINRENETVVSKKHKIKQVFKADDASQPPSYGKKTPF